MQPSVEPPITEPLAAVVTASHPAGHFYSPIVDPAELLPRTSELWPEKPPEILGIDFNDAYHREVLQADFPRFMADYQYVEREADTTSATQFYTQNSQFSWLDARVCFVLLRKWRPKRIIEVGSGFSSLLMADVNQRFFGGACEITCVEPYPRPFLKQGVAGLTRVIEQKVQAVPLALFETLETGDVLFIDSSHVAKTGSDVNYLYFEVLPRLKAGVFIHVHDIFLPNEYLKEWVFTENRSWNEQYVLRALLMYSTMFRVKFGCAYAFATMLPMVQDALNHPKRHGFAGGSIWLEKVQ
jgi:predicted O-methyltransferase YrrM